MNAMTISRTLQFRLVQWIVAALALAMAGESTAQLSEPTTGCARARGVHYSDYLAWGRFKQFLDESNRKADAAADRALPLDPHLHASDLAVAYFQVSSSIRAIATRADELSTASRDEALRRYFRTLFVLKSQQADFFSVGGTLLRARAENNLELVGAALSSLVSKEARAFALPVVSRAVLETRIRSWRPTAQASWERTRHEIVGATHLLYKCAFPEEYDPKTHPDYGKPGEPFVLPAPSSK